MKVYLSSTFADLEEYRQTVTRVLARLGFEYVRLDDFGAFDSSVLESSYDAIATSDLFVLLLAHRYGYRPPHETKSILELEYEQAVKLNKPVLAFVVKDAASWPVDKIDRDRRDQDALRAFKDRLLERHLVAYFDSPEELAQQVAFSTAQYSRKVEAFPIEPPPPTEQPSEPSVANVMSAVKEIQIELSVLRGLIADAARGMRKPDSHGERPTNRAAEFLGSGAVSTNPTRCFVIMPYSEQWSSDVEKIILEVCNEVGLEFTIAKSMEGRFIPHDIWNGITGAGVIVADLSGANPNVTYEVGLADVLGREVIMICQGDDVPFDFLGQRLVKYEDSLTGARMLREELTTRLSKHKDRVAADSPPESGS
ncbi:MAG: DUF4062 domain-containing protein [Nitrospira sp.]|nr:DUF4062 domain-containing protein [Nitrospira sp.]